MTRKYEVTSMEVLPQLDAHDDVVINLNFTYGDNSASLEGSCSLLAPDPETPGPFIPLESVTKEIALQWLLENCLNTTEEFDASLDAQIAEKANEPFVYDWAPPLPEQPPEE